MPSIDYLENTTDDWLVCAVKAEQHLLSFFIKIFPLQVYEQQPFCRVYNASFSERTFSISTQQFIAAHSSSSLLLKLLCSPGRNVQSCLTAFKKRNGEIIIFKMKIKNKCIMSWDMSGGYIPEACFVQECICIQWMVHVRFLKSSFGTSRRKAGIGLGSC